MTLGDYRLSYRRQVPVADAGGVVVLGRPVDPATGAVGAEAVGAELAKAHARGEFLNSLDDIAGRFLVIVLTDDGPRLYQDAAGTRTVFYRPPLAASHSALAAEDPDAIDPQVLSIWEKVSKTSQAVRYLPGLVAPHEGVSALTPNTSLSVATGKVRRFWPRGERVEVDDISLLAERVAQILKATAELAAEQWPLMMSLTAGLDSRLTLAACRSVTDRIGFFSHVNPDNPHRIHQADLDVARDMASVLDLSHRVFYLGDQAKGEHYDHFGEVWKTNMGIARGIPTLVKGYVDHWPPDVLHLRSNVAEIGRVFYKGDRLGEVTPATLTPWWNRDLGDDPDSVATFARFCATTDFTHDSMAGYDPLDIFYWEHRMGTWHAWLCMESDVAHDTFPIYSNRRLLEVMLSAPFEARLEAAVFHRAIASLWPELTEWPINPKRWQPGGPA